MFKRDFLGDAVSLLGYGCMRFPTTAEGEIDEPAAEALLDRAYAAGVNYYDCAWGYHNGKSESFVGKAMSKYPRNSFFFATKLPMWSTESKEQAMDIFRQQLEHLQTDYVDFYLIHCLNKELWQKVVDQGILPELVRLKKEGKIRHLGFSFHDSYEVFEEILRYYDWDFCQLQINYMDQNDQAGPKGRALAESLGIPIVVMEPVKGGALSNYAPEINQIFYDANPDATVSSWALRWVASLPNIKVVLSGMSTMEQVEDNLRTLGEFRPMDDAEKAVVDHAIAAINARVENGCTGCKYCMPCPFGVDIPGNFAIWNWDAMYNGGARAVRRYAHLEDGRAEFCHRCGVCMTKCPQHLSIPEDLAKLAKKYKA